MAVNMPIEDPFLKPDFQLLSLSGSWEVELQQVWMLSVIITRDGKRGGYPLNIEWEDDKPTAFSYAVGDPDSSERWVWRKIP